MKREESAPLFARMHLRFLPSCVHLSMCATSAAVSSRMKRLLLGLSVVAANPKKFRVTSFWQTNQEAFANPATEIHRRGPGH